MVQEPHALQHQHLGEALIWAAVRFRELSYRNGRVDAFSFISYCFKNAFLFQKCSLRAIFASDFDRFALYSEHTLGGASAKDPTCQCRRPRVQSLGWEDALEEGMETHSSFRAWEISDVGTWKAIIHRVAKNLT